jgi:TPR repeat protein
MTHATRFVAVAVLVALVLLNVSCGAQTPETDFEPEETNAPVQALTPLIDALRVRAEQGDASAQFNLGSRYDNGLGVPQDDAEAVRWYRLSAEQGVARAQVNLGVMYGNGEGVPQDDVEAHMWFNLAASRMTGEDRESADEARDFTAGLMNPTQIAEAQRLAREWDTAHPREP